MTKMYFCAFFFSVLSVGAMKTLNIEGRVGDNVTVECSDWGIWSSVKSNVKYICYDPCTEDKHIIIKAAFKKTAHKDRIYINNIQEGLFVTFTDLKISDSKMYYCAVQRFGRDTFLGLNLKVKNAEPTPAKPATVGSTVSPAVTTTSYKSSSDSDVSEGSFNTSTTVTVTSTASTTQGAGSLPYLTSGFIVVVASLLILLMCMRRVKRQQKVVTITESPHENDMDVEYSEIRPGEWQTLSAGDTDADTAGLYANYSHPPDADVIDQCHNEYTNDIPFMSTSSEFARRGACAGSKTSTPPTDPFYSNVQLPKRTQQPQTTQSTDMEMDSLYTLAELPRAT